MWEFKVQLLAPATDWQHIRTLNALAKEEWEFVGYIHHANTSSSALLKRSLRSSYAYTHKAVTEDEAAVDHTLHNAKETLRIVRDDRDLVLADLAMWKGRATVLAKALQERVQDHEQVLQVAQVMKEILDAGT